MSTDGQKTQIENISSNSPNKNSFIELLNSLKPDERIKIKELHNTLIGNKKEEFEEKILENTKVPDDGLNLDKIDEVIGEYLESGKKTKVEQEETKVEQQKNRVIQETADTSSKTSKDLIEKNISKNRVENILEKAKVTVENFYKIFGGKEQLNSKLAEKGINVDELRKNSEMQVLADIKKDAEERKKNGEEPVELSEENIQTKIDVSFIANNKKIISSVVPDDRKSELEAMYDNIRQSAISLGVSFRETDNHGDGTKFGIFDKERILVIDRQEVAISIPDGTEVTRRGGIISYEKDGYLVEIDIDEKPPERRIKGEGVDIKVDNKDIKYDRYGFIVKRKKLEGTIEGIKDYLSSNKSKVEQIKNTNKSLEQDYNIKLENYKKGVYIEKNEKGEFAPINLPAPQNREVAEQGLKEDYEKIIKDRQLIKTYEEQEKILKQKGVELVELKKEEQDAVSRFKKSIEERDEIAKTNIKYLAKTHLNIFGENNIDRIINLFNKHRAINGNAGDRPVDIDNGFRDSDKSIMINGMSKLLGGLKYFRNINEPLDFVNGQKVDKRFITEKLKQAGVLTKDGVTVNYSKVEELLSSTMQKQDKNKKSQQEVEPQVK